MTSIKARLGTFDLTMVIISLVIGIGIFRTPQMVALKAGTLSMFYTAWIAGAVVSACGALTFAEIGSRYPVAGAFYRIFSLCYHPAIAFMLNWSLVIINASSAASVALIGAEYIAPIFFTAPIAHSTIQLIVVSTIVVLYALNMFGIRSGARTQNVLSVLKVVLILVFISAIFVSPSATSTAMSPTTQSAISSSPVPTPAAADSSIISMLLALGSALIPVFFSYGGYQGTINFGADVREASRRMPRAIVGAMTIVLILYLAINYAYVNVLGFDSLQSSPLVAGALATRIMGSVGERFTAIAIFISVLGFLNSAFLFNPRIWYAMADERMLPSIFARMNARTGVQEFSLTLFTIMVLIMFFALGTFEKLLSYVMFTDTITLATAAACVFIMRKRNVRSDNEVYTLPSLVIPVVFIATICCITVSVTINDTQNAIIGATVIALGYPLYLVFRRMLRA